MSLVRLGQRANPFCLTTVFCVMAFSLAGCSKPPGTISGTVSYKGRPLSYGAIVFMTQPDQISCTGEIDSDGSFKVANVPAGPTKVAVIAEKLQELTDDPGARAVKNAKNKKTDGDPAKEKKSKRDAPPAPKAKKEAVIPDKYKDPEKSGISYTVKSGSQKKDFDLGSE